MGIIGKNMEKNMGKYGKISGNMEISISFIFIYHGEYGKIIRFSMGIFMIWKNHGEYDGDISSGFSH